MAQSRNEAALENLVGGDNQLLEPVSRNEKILHNLLGESYELDAPTSRIETLLMQMVEQGFMSEEDFYETVLTATYGAA